MTLAVKDSLASEYVGLIFYAPESKFTRTSKTHANKIVQSYKTCFPCLTQLRTKFVLLINVKISPIIIIVGILTFISMIIIYNI